jgi:hypothetical protein
MGPADVAVRDSRMICDWRTLRRTSLSAGENGVAETSKVFCSSPPGVRRAAMRCTCT